MIVQVLICATLFLIGIGCVIRANLLFGDVVAEINKMLPEERAISLSGFVRHRFGEIMVEYKKLYPDGKLAHRFHIWTAIGFACLIGFAGFLLFSGVGSASFIPRQR
jgi:hypothetical protein